MSPSGRSSNLCELTSRVAFNDLRNDRFCEGFRMTAARDDSAGTEAVVRKPPRKEPAGSEARLLPARYGDLIGAMTAAGQLGVPVR